MFHVKRLLGVNRVCYAPRMEAWEQEVRIGLRAMGVPCDDAQVGQLLGHLALVTEANRSFNLTTIPEAEFVALHVLDSASALAALECAPEGEFADIGSGAGFPGMPLGILSLRRVCLVESVKKKAGFLERAAAQLRLDASVRGVRAEELVAERPEAFAAVTARALSSLPSLVELAAPLLQMQGRLICLKGSPEREEISRGLAVAARCGMELVSTTVVEVPGVDAQRTIVVYRRCAAGAVSLPRRNGMAQRQPLA